MFAICRFFHLAIAFDGEPLFEGLDATLSVGVTGLIGANGRGKSVLLKLLAGDLAALAGEIHWACPRLRVDQLAPLRGPRVAEALGVSALHETFSRIERGAGSLEDLDRVADLWHLPSRWQALLAEAGLDIDLEAPVTRLSGGQRTRLALCAAFLKRDHYLLLDEPTNHLDGAGRDWLATRLAEHPGGALVASHDRTLLRRCDRLLELGESELRPYGGGYDLYREVREAERAALERRIEGEEKTLRRVRQEREDARRRAARRQGQGERLRRSGSQSKLLLDAKAQWAQRSASKVQARHEARAARLEETLRDDKIRRECQRPQRLSATREGLRGGVRLHLERVQLPWGTHSPISLTLHGGERWRIAGANGAGKSTLLRVIAGRLAPRAGECRRHGRCAYLDQDFDLLDTERSALENLCRLHPEFPPADWRTRLAGLRLRGDRALLPVAALSGGERLKVALLAVLGGERAPDLLLLDEPDNHLDLDSRELLENTLADYPGTLLVVSHDESFIEALAVERTLWL
ncbi:ABC-F family ATP-binding cassette domain-containing protein [Billgrantia endophytica]|uniref:ABC transporter ATP-binding protein n=1 Tax=Billgrantia endophytica TaxID=2033802 RepID=A0A2N7U7Z0_9GAMM|nr:ATP-binding cassette domain-containing protein [Halomonas endophytica]PMR76539.1 ABC transporter ATP-binding protein [Halomonas endophytica]